MIKAVLFDLDNTLIDFFKFKRECINSSIDAMISAGLKIKKEEARKIIRDIFNRFGMEYKKVFQEFLKKVNGKIDYRLLAHALIAYRKIRSRLLVPYPEVKKVLEKIKKSYKIAIVSDAPRQKVWIRMVLIGIDKLFNFVITFDDTKKRKPHKLPFQKAMKKLKLNPEEIMIVGDSISRDMVGGKKVGMKTCLALYGRTLVPKTKPKSVDFMIKNIEELLDILKKT